MKKIRSSQLESHIPYFGQKQEEDKTDRYPITPVISDDYDSELSADKYPELSDKNRLGTAVFGGTNDFSILEQKKEIYLIANASKKTKMIFYTKREIILYKDGSFGQKFKSKNKSHLIKFIIEP